MAVRKTKHRQNKKPSQYPSNPIQHHKHPPVLTLRPSHPIPVASIPRLVSLTAKAAKDSAQLGDWNRASPAWSSSAASAAHPWAWKVPNAWSPGKHLVLVGRKGGEKPLGKNDWFQLYIYIYIISLKTPRCIVYHFSENITKWETCPNHFRHSFIY